MPNSPDLLTRALQNPTLREAERGRRRARDGTDRDVLAWIEATFGVHIPAVACCEGHVAPAQAFCDALRARASVALWIASRGFGGKTFLLALLAAANAILFETDVIILGGSGQQSARVVECLHRLLAAGQVPPAWLASAPTFTKITLAWGNTIQALTASQTAVRGAHPTRLLLDEIDEMELRILEAAQGQPMDRNGVRAQTVMSSTHQYPDGTVTAMRRRAAELGWPVSEWCYRETREPHGWLSEDQVTRKRGELSRTMWDVEYELQEPSAEGRAIHPAAVERMFDATLGTHITAGDLEHLWRGQPGPPAERAWPDPAGAWYCIGVDWAQKRHHTVAVALRCDTTPLQVVAAYRAQRRSWQVMTAHVGALLDEYPGPAAHDETGAGSRDWGVPGARTPRPARGGHAGRACSDRPVPELHWGHRTARDRLSSDRRVLYRAQVLRGRRSVRERASARYGRRHGVGLSRLQDGPAARRLRHHPLTVGRAHRLNSRAVQVHSAAARGSPHIAVPSPPHISLPCAAHQSECGRTPPARGRHQGGT